MITCRENRHHIIRRQQIVGKQGKEIVLTNKIRKQVEKYQQDEQQLMKLHVVGSQAFLLAFASTNHTHEYSSLLQQRR